MAPVTVLLPCWPLGRRQEEPRPRRPQTDSYLPVALVSYRRIAARVPPPEQSQTSTSPLRLTNDRAFGCSFPPVCCFSSFFLAKNKKTKKGGETVLVRPKSTFSRERPEIVPMGHVWLEGDNAANSSDSRNYGPVPLAMVRSRVFFKVRREGATVRESIAFCFCCSMILLICMANNEGIRRPMTLPTYTVNHRGTASLIRPEMTGLVGGRTYGICRRARRARRASARWLTAGRQCLGEPYGILPCGPPLHEPV